MSTSAPLRLKALQALFSECSVLPLVFFRILFGFLLFMETFVYLAKGYVKSHWMIPVHNFTLKPFDFIRPLEGQGMIILFVILGILAVFIMLGLWYRLSIIAFFILFTYVFLIEQAYYLNHFYLISLLSFVMIFLPLHQYGSLDNRLGLRRPLPMAQIWCLWVLRGMIAIPYFFGGIAKINADWLRGQPMTLWIQKEKDFPLLGGLFQYDFTGLFMSYSSLLLDLLIVPALLWKKTRMPAFMLITLFHLMNAKLFAIGIFPWLMLGSSLLFFPPDFFVSVWNKVTGQKPVSVKPISKTQSVQPLTGRQKMILSCIVLWFLIQCIIPLRHFVIPGHVLWTEEGELYSWSMKLKDKRATGTFTIMNKKSGEKRDLPIANYITRRQQAIMLFKPDMIWQFAQLVHKKYKANGVDVALYGQISVSLNGRPYHPFIDPNVDLIAAPRPGRGAPWILPFNNQLPSPQK